MTTEQLLSLISTITVLAQALAWPLVALFVVVRYAPELIKLLGSGKDVSVKVLGVEATFTNSVTQAAVALSTAQANRAALADGAAWDESVSRGLSEGADARRTPIAESVADTITRSVPNPQVQQDLQGASVLWVDDNPDNNRYEREAFQALGVRCELSTSTEDALRQLGRRTFDAIISDMGRGTEQEAGLHLLDAVRRTDKATPFFIYAGSSAVRRREEALARGAQGSTNSPQDLMAQVIKAVRNSRKH